VNKGETIITGKVLVTCTVTIADLGSHSGTGEEWADDPNGMTAADAQAFKRACAVFGLGRYFYDFNPPWGDLDQNRQPRKTPPLPAWALPENWRKGMRPPGRNGNGKTPASNNLGANGGNGVGHAAVSPLRPSNGTNGHDCTNGTSIPASGNGHASDGNTNGANGTASNDLDARILQMEASVGAAFYRNILREHGRVNQPKLIRDVAVKQKVLRVLESAARSKGSKGRGDAPGCSTEGRGKPRRASQEHACLLHARARTETARRRVEHHPAAEKRASLTAG